MLEKKETAEVVKDFLFEILENLPEELALRLRALERSWHTLSEELEGIRQRASPLGDRADTDEERQRCRRMSRSLLRLRQELNYQKTAIVNLLDCLTKLTVVAPLIEELKGLLADPDVCDGEET